MILGRHAVAPTRASCLCRQAGVAATAPRCRQSPGQRTCSFGLQCGASIACRRVCVYLGAISQ